MLLQILWFGYTIGEITCPTRYTTDAASINFCRSVRYGLGCLTTAASFRLVKWNFHTSRLFSPGGGPTTVKREQGIPTVKRDQGICILLAVAVFAVWADTTSCDSMTRSMWCGTRTSTRARHHDASRCAERHGDSKDP